MKTATCAYCKKSYPKTAMEGTVVVNGIKVFVCSSECKKALSK